MKFAKIFLSAVNLFFFGIYLHIFKKLISGLIKRNAPLSKKHIVLAFKIYERSLIHWQQKEKKHLILIKNTI